MLVAYFVAAGEDERQELQIISPDAVEPPPTALEHLVIMRTE